MESRTSLHAHTRADSTAHSSAPRPRKHSRPLQDTTQWVNDQISITQFPSPNLTRNTASPPVQGIPHHTSLALHGTLQTRQDSHLSPVKAQDKRVSVVSSEEARNNRDSQYSNASTNASGKSKTKKAVGPWRLGATIGKGATGRVRKARHQQTGQDAAIKIINKKTAEMCKSASIIAMDSLMSNNGTAGDRKVIPFGIERECVIMKLIDHPNIISLYDMWENRGELYLVLEHVGGGELFDFIQKNGRLKEATAMKIFRQIVAALSYCHSFHICHRDLKPENILLDNNGNVKLADFGMAALQPAKQWLQTSCGSPHYACPEVIQQLPYRGDLADVWSAGVVLYAMLCGCLPFQSNEENPEQNMRDIARQVVAGEYYLPDDILSQGTMDIILRCLQSDPRKRWQTHHMWKHPLMVAYEDLDPPDSSGRRYIGPAPHYLEQECGRPFKYKSQIDSEVLRNLRNLWHSVPEAHLVEKLMRPEPNHERIVYAKLRQFQDKLLENYPLPEVGYSTSDYHHAAVEIPSTASLPPPDMGQQHASRFSLLQPGTALPRRLQSHTGNAHARHFSNAITEATEESYDPFRPSKTRIASAKHEDRTKITVLRNASRATSRSVSLRPQSRAMARNPTLARIQAQDRGSVRVSPYSMQNLALAGSKRPFSRCSSRVTLQSRCSINSNGSSMVFTKSMNSRRNVTFPHQQRRLLSGQRNLRRRSTGQQKSALTMFQRYQQGAVQPSIGEGGPTTSAEADASGCLGGPPQRSPSPPPIKSPRKRLKVENGQPSRRISQYARKESHEFARFIDETFNRESVASTVHTSATPATTYRDSQQSYQTRTTSMSLHDVPRPALPPSRDGLSTADKPLPPAPGGYKHSYLSTDTERQLAKTTELLKQKARSSCMTPGALDEIIVHLERLMQPSRIRVIEEQRRAASTPDPNIPRKDTFERIVGPTAGANRTASEPIQATDGRPKSTIRLVQDDDSDYRSLHPIPPLTIRKSSGSSGRTPGSLPQSQRTSFAEVQAEVQNVNGHDDGDEGGLHAIQETSDKENFDPLHRQDRHVGEKRRHWFRRHHQPKKSRDLEIGPPLNLRKDELFVEPQPPPSSSKAHARPKPHVESRPPLSKKKSLLNLLTNFREKRQSEPLPCSNYNIDDSASDTSSLHEQKSHTRRRESVPSLIRRKSSRPDLVDPQPTNWLTRFFRIKPATHVLCFQISKSNARRELLLAFRHWQEYGLRDITVTKAQVAQAANTPATPTTIRARVDVNNSLNLPPAQIACQLHEILFQGRRARLSITRLVQEKGAKSTFERLSWELKRVLREKGVLVEDKKIVKEMKAGAGFR